MKSHPIDFLPAGESIGNEHQIRTVTLTNSPQLPGGEYKFVDFYCIDRDCDCRKTMILVHHNGKHVSTVNYGWENPSFYFKWLYGNDQELANEMSGLSNDITSPDLIDPIATIALVEYLLDDEWIARIKSTYQKVRAVINSRPRLSRPPSRNAPCPCGSGKKHKSCCGKK